MREVTRDVGRESKYDRIYRRIEAMYHKGFSIEGIVKQFPNLPRFEVLDIIQKIDALERIKKGDR